MTEPPTPSSSAAVGAPDDVLVAMSGGVDSSVAAALLADAGHRVVGVTLKLWGGESDSGCCSVSDVDDARSVARRLGVDHHVFNFGDEFERHVVEPYVDAHRRGRTPNPCIECNRHIKFDKLFRRADALGFETVATGHHARIVTDGDGRLRVARGADRAKDQSYVLHMLNQSQLARVRFPVGDRSKDEVRRLAAERGLVTAAKPDSQDVCFIHSDGGRREFLGDRIPLAPATVVDTGGRPVGHVASVELVTIGQRRGLDLGGDTGRRYVVDIDRHEGLVTVGHRHDLLSDRQEIDDLAWSAQPLEGPLELQCSAHGRPRPGRIEGATVVWDEPQPRVAPGQSIVAYRGDLVVGGGTASARR
ncbi:MAG: tRNA 2-thiouridine(34) synthase MnmA [Acidimicrobiales bacterium]